MKALTNVTDFNITLRDDNVNESLCSSSADFIYDLRKIPDDDFIASLFFYSLQERFFILTFFPMLLTFGLIGNLAFLVVVAKVNGMRTITNAYLTSLAICDIIFIFFSINDVLVSYLISPVVRTKGYDSNFDCALGNGSIFATHFTADCLLVFMSLERYLAICKPLNYRIISSKGRTLKLIVSSWVFGILFSLVVTPRFSSLTKSCVLWPKRKQYENLSRYLRSCSTTHRVFNWLSDIAMSIPYFTAFLLNTVMYCLIIRKLHKRVRQIGDISSRGSRERELEIQQPSEHVSEPVPAGQANAHNVRNKVARLLIAIGTSYFLCFLPYIITRLNSVFLYLSDNQVGLLLSDKQSWIMYWVVVGLATLNSVINPVIYSVTNARYRNAFKRVFLCDIRWASGRFRAENILLHPLYYMCIYFSIDKDQMKAKFLCERTIFLLKIK